jgi:catechol 2,3-dioxygenase-like lactoylglutathione lyase family enzyme
MVRVILVVAVIALRPGADPGASSPQLPAARPAATPAPLFTTTGAFFALSVADLAASTAWYTEKFGLRTVTSASQDNASFALLEGSGLIVELVQLRDAVPLAKAAPSARGRELIHGLFKAGIVVDDFDALVAGLKTRGIEVAYGPFAKQATQRANVIVRDNAGNLIQFFGRA